MEDVEKFQETVRNIVEKGLLEDPKKRQFEAVDLEKNLAAKV